jgi:REP element-mobilizing transposase RayT
MILAYHVIFTAYGFWLPNDPRGSWSIFVAAWELLLAGGKATKTSERRSLASEPHDRGKRMKAKEAPKYPPVEFTGVQALAIAHGFALAIQEAGYVVYACSILPTHVHLVIARLSRNITTVVGHLKSKASHRLRAEGCHPMEAYVRHDGSVPSVWAEGSWKVFLDSPEDVRRAIEYVEENPMKEGKPRQRWSFVRAWGK